jgi:hypothetical protein
MPTFYVLRITNTASYASVNADSEAEAQEIADTLSQDLFTGTDIEVTNIVSELPL